MSERQEEVNDASVDRGIYVINFHEKQRDSNLSFHETMRYFIIEVKRPRLFEKDGEGYFCGSTLAL